MGLKFISLETSTIYNNLLVEGARKYIIHSYTQNNKNIQNNLSILKNLIL